MKGSFKARLEGESPCAPAADNGALGADELIKKYSGMSENELMRELKAETDRQRTEGRFDGGAIKKGMEAIMPMLNEGQKQKLKDIIGRLNP